MIANQTGGRRAAVLFSLVASCKRNQVEPWAYLRDVLTQLPLLRAARERGEDVTPQLDALLCPASVGTGMGAVRVKNNRPEFFDGDAQAFFPGSEGGDRTAALGRQGANF
jgi:hypothetical protein